MLQMNEELVAAERPFKPVERIAGDLNTGLIFLCDHARRDLPGDYGDLGLPAAQFDRHIAYDIGAEAVTMGLAERFNAPAVLTRYSRLLIDPNRGEDDPTLIMPLSDGAVVPGNRHVSANERMKRLTLYYRPYHDAIATLIDEALMEGIVPVIVSVHSFTHNWRGASRPWHVGILWDRDPRLAVPMIEAFRQQEGLVVGDNEPYTGALKGDTMYRHGTRRGLAHALIEYRQDLVGEAAGVADWVERSEQVLRAILNAPDLRDIRHFGSKSDSRRLER